MKKNNNTVRIVCIVLAGLFVLSLIVIPLFYLLGP